MNFVWDCKLANFTLCSKVKMGLDKWVHICWENKLDSGRKGILCPACYQASAVSVSLSKQCSYHEIEQTCCMHGKGIMGFPLNHCFIGQFNPWMTGWDRVTIKSLLFSQNEYEQLNYAKQLKERLEAFTRDFLPHMKEEEEVGKDSLQMLWRSSLGFGITE